MENMTTKDTTELPDGSQGRGPYPKALEHVHPHVGVQVSGRNGAEGRKAFYIHIEAIAGKENDVMRMLEDILGCVNDEPATGPWYALR